MQANPPRRRLAPRPPQLRPSRVAAPPHTSGLYLTPRQFEPSHEPRPARMFTHKVGALAGGNDIEKGHYTLQDAVAHAAQIPHCKGFTFCSPHPSPGGRLEVYFKSSTEGNSDGNWQTYLRTQGGGHVHPGGARHHHGGGNAPGHRGPGHRDGHHPVAHHPQPGHGRHGASPDGPPTGVPIVLIGFTGHTLQCLKQEAGRAHCVNTNHGAYETLTLKKADARHYIIRSAHNGQNLQCRPDGSVSFCTANEGDWEQFSIEKQSAPGHRDKYFFVSKHTGRTLQCSGEPGPHTNKVHCCNTNRGEWETWHVAELPAHGGAPGHRHPQPGGRKHPHHHGGGGGAAIEQAAAAQAAAAAAQAQAIAAQEEMRRMQLYQEACSLRDKQRFQQAAEAFERLIQMGHTDPGLCHNEKGQCLEELGQMDQALREFDKAIRHDSSVARYVTIPETRSI
eukprot:COSAG05_NODE_920_length_6588_cov_5.627061_2_plen_449_part_00